MCSDASMSINDACMLQLNRRARVVALRCLLGLGGNVFRVVLGADVARMGILYAVLRLERVDQRLH